MDVIIHADDFGITPEQSRTILACAREGVLNSTSVIVASPAFEECARLLAEAPEGFRVALHLNLVEGKASADPSQIPLLVGEDGMFNRSFVDLFRMSMSGRADELARQVAIETSAQIDRLASAVPGFREHLRVDGHQHFQLIPAVFRGMMDAIERSGGTLEYLRVPAEPLGPFLPPRVFFGISPVNWVKHMILNWCWRRDRRRLPNYTQVSALFCGVLFSGQMSAERVLATFPSYVERARRAGMDVEFLFHPGGVADPSECLNPQLEGFVAFYQSEGRAIEKSALMQLSLEGQRTDAPRIVRAGGEADHE